MWFNTRETPGIVVSFSSFYCNLFLGTQELYYVGNGTKGQDGNFYKGVFIRNKFYTE